MPGLAIIVMKRSLQMYMLNYMYNYMLNMNQYCGVDPKRLVQFRFHHRLATGLCA